MKRARQVAVTMVALVSGFGGFWMACHVLAMGDGLCLHSPIARAWNAPRLGAAPDRTLPANEKPDDEEESVQAGEETPAPEQLPARAPRRVRRVAVAEATPVAQFGEPLDPELALRNALRLAQPAFELCYQTALKTDQRLKGRIVVELSLQAVGLVSAARVVESSLKDDGVSACITRKLRSMRLPPLSEDADVTVPLTLVPRPG